MEQDSLVVDGPTAIQGGIVSSSGDHRIAMALVAAGLAAEGEVVITDAQCADVSFRDSSRVCSLWCRSFN
jgi:3-phosphoshikimate 1-carboxyvinyltransferase